MALSLGAFVIGKLEHDRPAAFDAFDRALALSPSSAFPLFMGCVVPAYAGYTERALEWAEEALRVSPNDRLDYSAHHCLALAYFSEGQYEASATAARRAIEANPNFSVSHSVSAAALARLDRMEEARIAGSGSATILQRAPILHHCRRRASAGRTTNGCVAKGRTASIGNGEPYLYRDQPPTEPTLYCPTLTTLAVIAEGCFEHEYQFSPARPNGRCRLGDATFFAIGNKEDWCPRKNDDREKAAKRHSPQRSATPGCRVFWLCRRGWRRCRSQGRRRRRSAGSRASGRCA
jgi:hypothetical protein